MTGTARWTTQGSWRPWSSSTAFSPFTMSTVNWVRAMEGVGRMVTSNTRGMPLVMPPLIPPAQFCSALTAPSSSIYSGSLASDPRIRAKAAPAPKPTAFTAGTANRYWEKIPSAFSPKSGPPSPAGRPNTAHSMAPPTLSCSSLASKIACRICSPAWSSNTGKSLSATARRLSQSSRSWSEMP